VTGINVKMEVNGLREALKEINKLDNKLRRQLTKDFAQAAEPMVQAARSQVPTKPPLSGMARRWKSSSKTDGPLWVGNEAGNIKASINTRRARSRNLGAGAKYETVGAVRVSTASKGAKKIQSRNLFIFDIAGRGTGNSEQGRILMEQLNARFGRGSRVMWPAAESTMDQVQNNLKPVVAKVMADYKRLKG